MLSPIAHIPTLALSLAHDTYE
ncbi:MAG: hypothetical protein JWP03_2045, partial [Phycisphaerales bacterium]|nr:hypothetical protein [Phycisphaerales bacterium]